MMVVSHVCIPCFTPFSPGLEDRFCQARFQASTRFSVGFQAVGLPALFPKVCRCHVAKGSERYGFHKGRPKNLKDGRATDKVSRLPEGVANGLQKKGLTTDDPGWQEIGFVSLRFRSMNMSRFLKGACPRQDFYIIVKRCRTHQQARYQKLPRQDWILSFQKKLLRQYKVPTEKSSARVSQSEQDMRRQGSAQKLLLRASESFSQRTQSSVDEFDHDMLFSVTGMMRMGSGESSHFLLVVVILSEHVQVRELANNSAS